MSNLHNEFAYGTGLLRALRLGLGMGEGDGVVRLDESLTAIIDFWQRPDWAILAGESLSWAYSSVGAGGAGTRSMSALVNPIGSGRVFIVEEVKSDVSNSQLLVQAPAPVNGVGGWVDSLGGQGTRDLRNTEIARVITNKTTTLLGVIRWELQLASVPFTLPIVVGPNNAVIVAPATDNLGFDANWAWRERMLLPGEPPKRT